MSRNTLPGAESFIGRGLHWLVLAILFGLTYLRLSSLPYSGFELDSNGRIVHIYVQSTTGHPLQAGDRLLRAGPVSWDTFQADHSALLFGGAKAGDVIALEIERADRQLSIPWIYPGSNLPQVLRYMMGGFWLGYLFWFAGTMTALQLRPMGQAWRLAIAFNYFNAIGSMFGGDAFFSHIFFSAFLVRIAVWIGVPLYLHFHWVWPRSLGRLPAGVLWFGYAVACALSAGEMLQLLPHNAYLVGLSLAILGSLILLLLHAVYQPVMRRKLLWLLLVVAAALIPLLVYAAVGHRMTPGAASILGSIGLPLIPLAYTAAAQQRRLGDLQIRMNSLAVPYAFVLLFGVLTLPIITILSLRITDWSGNLVLISCAVVAGAVAGIFAYPAFRAFLERRYLGMPFPEDALVREFISRITVAPSIPMLVAVLRDQILPSLLVRQFLFVELDRDRPRVLLAMGLSRGEMPSTEALQRLVSEEGRYPALADSAPAVPYPWIRLVMGLQVQDQRLGLWLLGRRDPDDEYPEQEVMLIRSLADQAAITLSHCVQTERLREMYQANVTRTEAERLKLALALHDKVLNELAGLLMRLDDPSITPAVTQSFEDFSGRLREIVSELRPPMLAYGLAPAFRELVVTLQERATRPVSLSAESLVGEARYPSAVELHLFRIVQESCENALRHSAAQRILISGRLDAERAVIEVVDDGSGFEAPDSAALGRLIAQKHFGLAGLIERANLIGGSVQIISALGQGTRVRAVWIPKETTPLPT